MPSTAHTAARLALASLTIAAALLCEFPFSAGRETSPEALFAGAVPSGDGRPFELPTVRPFVQLLKARADKGAAVFHEQKQLLEIPREQLADATRAAADYVWAFMPFPGPRPPLSLEAGDYLQATTWFRTRRRQFRPGHRPVVINRRFAEQLLAGKPDALHSLIHEWAHAFQSADTYYKLLATGPDPGTAIRLAEGAADAFADLVAPVVYRRAGIAYRAGDYHGYPLGWVTAARAQGKDWIAREQFAELVRPPLRFVQALAE